MAKSHCRHQKECDKNLKTKDCCKKKSCHCNELSSENIIDPSYFGKPDPVCCIKDDPVHENKCELNETNHCEDPVNDEVFSRYLNNYIGQTVTIFTTSGGESGSGFTGVLMSIECNFLRLLSQIGPAPGCALGNCCDDFYGSEIGLRFQTDNYSSYPQENNRSKCNLSGIGSVVVIPINLIAAFVHNAVGSSL